MWDSIKQLWTLSKPYVTGMAVRWLLKVGGGVIAYSGWEGQQFEVVVGGILSIIVGVVISLLQNKKAVLTPPPGQ